MAEPWRKWLRACARDPHSPAELPGPLGILTGQDARALDAIAACWQLYASGDDDARRGALRAVRSLLPGMQPKCRGFARELIAWAMDWRDREPLWLEVSPVPASTPLVNLRGGAFGVYINEPKGEHLSGYLCASSARLITPWAREAQRFDTLEDAHAEIARRGIDRDTSVRPGRLTAYACWVP